MPYKIIYKQGVDNPVADALSRHPHPSSQLLSVPHVVPQWTNEIVEGYSVDPRAQKFTCQASNLFLQCCPQQGVSVPGSLWSFSRTFAIDLSSEATVLELSELLQEKELMNQLIQQHLFRAHQRMKVQADKNRS